MYMHLQKFDKIFIKEMHNKWKYFESHTKIMVWYIRHVHESTKEWVYFAITVDTK